MLSFSLENVKSFVKTGDIELKRINIFVGKNSSGKSSLVRFPVMLSQTFSEEVFTPFLFYGNQIDYGNFEDVVHNHIGDSMTFNFGFGYRDIKRYLISAPFTSREPEVRRMFIKLISKNNINIKVKIGKQNKKIIVDQFTLSIGENNICDFLKSSKNTYELKLYKILKDSELQNVKEEFIYKPQLNFQKFIPYLEVYNDEFYEDLLKKIDKDRVFASNQTIIDLLVSSKNNDDKMIENLAIEFGLNEKDVEIISKTNNYYDTILMINLIMRSLNRNMNNFANTVSYIGPFRKDPERIYRDSESSMLDVGKNGENISMILRQAQQDKNPLLNKVSEWFLKSMGVSITIEDIENSNLYKLMVTNNGVNHNIIDVGYGIAQVLPIVTQIYYNNNSEDERKRNLYRFDKRKVFIIEQPELHLHPAAQASLADLFVEKIVKDNETKFIIETHSEHFIRKLQVLVADPRVKISQDDIGIYYVDKGEDGQSCVNQININSKGQFIEKWPSGFFDKSFELSRELMKVSNIEVDK